MGLLDKAISAEQRGETIEPYKSPISPVMPHPEEKLGFWDKFRNSGWAEGLVGLGSSLMANSWVDPIRGTGGWGAGLGQGMPMLAQSVQEHRKRKKFEDWLLRNSSYTGLDISPELVGMMEPSQIAELVLKNQLKGADTDAPTIKEIEQDGYKVTIQWNPKLRKWEEIARTPVGQLTPYQEQALALERANLALRESQGRIPPGYRMSADGSSLEAIPGGPVTIGKPLPSKIAGDMQKQGMIVDTTERLADQFRDEYAGQPLIGGLHNLSGRVFGDDGQAQWWQDYQYQQNVVRHELFGAALTATETAQWNQAAINPGMAPSQIRKNLARRKEIETKALNRLMRSNAAAGYNRQQIEEISGRPISDAAPGGQAPSPSSGLSGGPVTSGNGIPQGQKRIRFDAQGNIIQ